VKRDDPAPSKGSTQAILRHWREAVPNDRLAHLVRDAAKGLTRALHLRLTEHSVGFGHWAFLRILWEKDGLAQRELSEQAGVTEATTFSALKAMEKRRYIVRKRYAGDRKKVFIFLTPKGRALKAKLVPLALEINEIAVRGVSTADIAIARKMLLRMIQNLADDEAKNLSGNRHKPKAKPARQSAY